MSEEKKPNETEVKENNAKKHDSQDENVDLANNNAKRIAWIKRIMKRPKR